nr:hypothetical protein Iba_chr14cCG3680 [Ipomoea batatas]
MNGSPPEANYVHYGLTSSIEILVNSRIWINFTSFNFAIIITPIHQSEATFSNKWHVHKPCTSQITSKISNSTHSAVKMGTGLKYTNEHVCKPLTTVLRIK